MGIGRPNPLKKRDDDDRLNVAGGIDVLSRRPLKGRKALTPNELNNSPCVVPRLSYMRYMTLCTAAFEVSCVRRRHFFSKSLACMFLVMLGSFTTSPSISGDILT
jgi:hypothetical protein